MIVFEKGNGIVAIDELSVTRCDGASESGLTRVHMLDGDHVTVAGNVASVAQKIGTAQEAARARIGTAR